MKAYLIRTLLIGAIATSARAQTAAPSAEATTPPSASAAGGVAAAPSTAPLAIPGTPSPSVTTRIPRAGGGAAGMSGSGYSSRLSGIVDRAPIASSDSAIICFDQRTPKQMDELAEDLNVFSFIVSRNLERSVGNHTTEYRLGVPMTMQSRMVQASYLQGFGVLVKVHVPFPLVSSGSAADEPAKSTAATEWEKARRALLGGGGDDFVPPGSAQEAVPYDEQLVNTLTVNMIDALENSANLRNVESGEGITIAVFGGPSVPSSSKSGQARGTVLTLRIKKEQAEELAKGKIKEDQFQSLTQKHAYFASENVGRMTGRAGAAGFGGGYGGAGNYAAPVGR